MNKIDKIKGAFVGLYFGSGVNPRFSPMLTPDEARKRFSDKEFGQYYDYEIYDHPYKLYDQHTQTKIIYEILIKYGRVTPEIFRDYLLELHNQYNVFEGDVYGPSTQAAVKAILAGEDIYKIGRKGITCGSAMRALPIGIYFYNNLDALVENTINSCIISHNTDVAIDAALITNITLANLLQGKSKFDAIAEAIEHIEKNHGKYGEKTNEPEIHEKVKSALNFLRGKSPDEAMYIIPEKIGVSWFARDTIPGAFANYIVSDTPEESSLLAMRCGGDNQTVPEIACCFLGAEKGPNIFPKDIVEKIEKINDIKIYELADKLIEKMDL